MATPFSSPKNHIVEPTIAEKLKSNVIAILIIADDAQVAIIQKHHLRRENERRCPKK